MRILGQHVPQGPNVIDLCLKASRGNVAVKQLYEVLSLTKNLFYAVVVPSVFSTCFCL